MVKYKFHKFAKSKIKYYARGSSNKESETTTK